MKKFIVLMLVMLVAAITQAELVTNGDFETGYVAGAVPDGWAWGNEIGGTYSGTIVSWASDGTNKYAHVVGPASWATTQTIGGIIQTGIAVTAGENYLFTFDAKNTSYTSWFSVMVDWKDSTDTRISYDNDWVGSYFSGTWGVNAWFVPSYSASGFVSSSSWWTYPERLVTAPDGAVTADIHFYAYMSCAHDYDNVSLVVPEPLTMSLLGLGALMLGRRKK